MKSPSDRVTARHLGEAIRVALCGCAVLSFTLFGAEEKDDVKCFVLTLVDQETRAAVEGAEIRVRVGGKGVETVKSTITSDREGVCKVPVPANLPDPHYLSLSIERADGYVLVSRGWGSFPDREPIPEEFTIELQKGTSIGGIVTNEEGEPIEGAEVEFLLSSEGRDFSYKIPSVKTGAQGKWRSPQAPRQMGHLSIRLEHPDYASNRVNSYQYSLPEKLLRDFSGVLVMKKGVTISGIVRDYRGKPIENALVTLGNSGFFTREDRTDAEGGFSFEHCEKESDTLTVQAAGKMPELRRVDPVEASEPLEFHLRPGREMRIQVVDQTGEPIEGVSVCPETYRGCRYVLTWDPEKGNKHLKTDEAGSVEWTSAPADEVTFAFSKDGYARLEKTLHPTGEEVQIVKLPRKLKVHGKVVDKETGKPLTNFRVARVLDWLTGSTPFLDRRESIEGVSEGNYEYELSRTDTGHYVRIEADGYLPAMSSMFKIGDAAELRFDFELVKGKNIAGFVKDAQGNPVVGAEVVLSTPSQHVSLNNGKLSRRDSALVTETGEDGHFSLYPQVEPYLIAILHESGGAVRTKAQLEESSMVEIRPWALVGGKLLRAGKPLANQRISLSEIRLYGESDPRFFSRYYTTTNAEGGYEFERVLPGSYVIAAELSPWRESDLTSSHNLPLQVEAGQTVRVNLGEAKQSVVGRAVLPAGVKRKMRWSYGINYLVAKKPGIPVPAAIRDKGFDWRKGWEEAWMGSQEGQAYFQTLEKHFVKLNPDGTFRIDGVSPGDYQLAIRVFDPPEGGG